MLKKIKWKIILVLVFLFSIAGFLSAFFLKKDNKNLKLVINTSNIFSENKFNSTEFSKKFLEILHKKYPQIKFKKLDLLINQNYLENLNQLQTQKNVIGFINFSNFKYTTLANEKNNLDLILQTTTDSFVFDKKISYYLNGSEKDPLIKIANEQTKKFLDSGYLSNGQKLRDFHTKNWNGVVYKNFYDEKIQIPFYRGIIWISGTEEEIRKIKKSWEEKDWKTFRKFKIVHGNFNSGGKFILQAQILKLHFNKPENTFSTLNEEIINYPEDFILGKAKREILKQEAKIFFDDEGAFAWNSNFDKGKKIGNYDFPQAHRLEILTSTNPFPYDLLVINKNTLDRGVDLNKFKKAIKETFLEMKTKGYDSYGKNIGYNGYQEFLDEKFLRNSYKWESYEN